MCELKCNTRVKALFQAHFCVKLTSQVKEGRQVVLLPHWRQFLNFVSEEGKVCVNHPGFFAHPVKSLKFKCQDFENGWTILNCSENGWMLILHSLLLLLYIMPQGFFGICLPPGFLPVLGMTEQWCCLWHLVQPCYVALGRALICACIQIKSP